MKNTFYLFSIPILIMLLMVFSCNQSTRSDNNNKEQIKSDTAVTEISQSHSSTYPGSLLTLDDAKKILGEKARLTDSSTTNRTDTSTFRSVYFAKTKDLKTNKTGCIYFLIEHYARLESAKEKYSFIRTANEHNGIKILNDLGDEAYFHSDNENFYFIMVRKGSDVFNMKVNKITSNTSLEEFKEIAKRITDNL